MEISSERTDSKKKEPLTYREAKAQFEKKYLIELLIWAEGNVNKAAQKADRDRKGIYQLLSKYGLNPARFRNKHIGNLK